MSLLDTIFNKPKPKYQAADFWKWLLKNKTRLDQLKTAIEQDAHQLLDEVIEELSQFNPWLKAVCGNYDDDTIELIITADGDIALFTKVQELIAAAPHLPGWRFTAHKPAVGLSNMGIRMYGKVFDESTLHFYPIEEPEYPDEVILVFTHPDYLPADHEDFQTAINMFVQNGIGELKAATLIDDMDYGSEPEDKTELIPIAKLDSYLLWREKEFVEKYQAGPIEKVPELYNVIEGQDEDGNVMIAIVNTAYENWSYKPAYQWLLSVSMEYEAAENGLPPEKMLAAMQLEEEQVIKMLVSQSEAIYVSSKTFKGARTACFYTRSYELPCQLMHKWADEHPNSVISGFFVEKDKYWRCLEEFWGLPEDLMEDDEEEGEE
jgi:hypothetical protein